jgi:glycosyltransferase involved in cell wall biosynthesis
MPNLNVWWIAQYASTPDQQLTAQYDLARQLVEKGHKVTFFAAGFSHYKFKEIRLEKGGNWRIDEHDGVRFVWIRTPSYHANDWRRARNMCSFAWRAYRAAQGIKEQPDVVIGTTFHTLASLSAYAVSVAKRVPFIFEVRDLWPLTMVEFGAVPSWNPVALALGTLEKFLARRAARIMSTLPGAPEYYQALGVPRDQTVWIPNGLNLSRYSGLKPYSGNISGPCKLMFAGGHVKASPLDMILRAAKLEQESSNGTQFVFVGGGQDKPRLIHLAQKLGLRNVVFKDVVPKSELCKVLEEADGFIVSMRNLPRLYRYGISFNKLCDYVAAGRPVLFAGDSSYNVVKEFHCGLVVPPEDPKAFFEAIQAFKALSAERRAEMGANGIRCAGERFDIAKLGTRLESMLISVVNDFRGYAESVPESLATR